MKYDNCQSCGMPLSKDPKGGGTEANGKLSTKYCSYCLTDGRFTQPAMTAEEMKKFVVDRMWEMKIPRFVGRFFVRNLHKLERWRG